MPKQVILAAANGKERLQRNLLLTIEKFWQNIRSGM
jgi:hypothetical protein